jgi:hypothetical protein
VLQPGDELGEIARRAMLQIAARSPRANLFDEVEHVVNVHRVSTHELLAELRLGISGARGSSSRRGSCSPRATSSLPVAGRAAR